MSDELAELKDRIDALAVDPRGRRTYTSLAVTRGRDTRRPFHVSYPPLAAGWTYDKVHDSFVKDGEMVMVKVVWRAYVQERGA